MFEHYAQFIMIIMHEWIYHRKIVFQCTIMYGEVLSGKLLAYHPVRQKIWIP